MLTKALALPLHCTRKLLRYYSNAEPQCRQEGRGTLAVGAVQRHTEAAQTTGVPAAQFCSRGGRSLELALLQQILTIYSQANWRPKQLVGPFQPLGANLFPAACDARGHVRAAIWVCY